MFYTVYSPTGFYTDSPTGVLYSNSPTGFYTDSPTGVLYSVLPYRCSIQYTPLQGFILTPLQVFYTVYSPTGGWNDICYMDNRSLPDSLCPLVAHPCLRGTSGDVQCVPLSPLPPTPRPQTSLTTLATQETGMSQSKFITPYTYTCMYLQFIAFGTNYSTYRCTYWAL